MVGAKIERSETFAALQTHIEFFKKAETIRTKWPSMESILSSQGCGCGNEHGHSRTKHKTIDGLVAC